jgi:cysteine desulfurase
MTPRDHYCDYNATAPIRPEALEAMRIAAEQGGNASSIHGAGRTAKALLEDARERLALCVGAQAANIVFTSGATEALHLALESSGAASLVVSAIEHDAVWLQAERLFPGFAAAPVTADGVVDLAALDSLLGKAAKPALAVVMLANNETGVIQPIPAIAALARQHGAMLLVDAAQALGRVPVDLQALDATFLVASSHKAGGPAGAGLLALAPGAPFSGLRAGGGQERGRRPGTENIPAVAGFAVAAEMGCAALSSEMARLAALRDLFEGEVTADGAFQALGASAERLCNTSLVACPGVRAETAVIALDLAGFAVSSGAACSSGKVRASRVLRAMGAPESLAGSALRASFGWRSTEEDAIGLARAMRALAERRAARPELEGAA